MTSRLRMAWISEVGLGRPGGCCRGRAVRWGRGWIVTVRWGQGRREAAAGGSSDLAAVYDERHCGMVVDPEPAAGEEGPQPCLDRRPPAAAAGAEQ